jgi:hypothetical protein
VERARWAKHHISVFDSPNYTGEQVSEKVRRSMPTAEWADEVRSAWGASSPMYQVRALGDFPEYSEDAVIPLGVVEAAQQRVYDGPADPKVIGVDVARFGDDETVIALRSGQRLRILEHYRGKPTTHTAGRVLHHADEHGVRKVVIDDTGVGGGVTDNLRASEREDFEVAAFDAAGKPRRPARFPNRRSEAWFEAAEILEDIDLDSDEQLAADLTSPRYEYDSKLRQVVESKDKTKARLGRSPDRADAVLLALTMPASGVMLIPPGRVPGWTTPRERW